MSSPQTTPARPEARECAKVWGILLVLACVALAPNCLAQTPAIYPGGVVNGASFAPGAPIAPGSIASIFGENLADTSDPATAEGIVASSLPLPTTLGGAMVRVNGIPAQLFYVSRKQINFLMPPELGDAAQGSVTVIVGASLSNPQTVSLATFAPGIFQLANGQGAILIANTATVAAPVTSIAGSQARPANPGEFITIYCTGLGPVTNQPPTGAPASSSPLSITTTAPAVRVGNIPATVSFSGLAPGFVGLYQVDVQIPPSAPAGNAVPITIQSRNAISNAVTIAIASSATGGVSVQVSPNLATVLVEQTQQFSAVVGNAQNTAVTWAVNGIAGGNSTVGTISTSGLYAAPDLVPNPPTVTITGVSQADPWKSGSAQVALSYPVPAIASIAPSGVPVGSSDTTITLGGTGFTKATTVNLGGRQLAAGYVSGTQTRATLPADAAAVAGSYTITAGNPPPGGGTASASLAVTNLTPVVASVSPGVIAVGAAATRVVVSGTNFLSASAVTVNGSPVPTVYLSSTQLVAPLAAASLSVAGTLNLTVSNPAPGGGTSNNVALLVSNQGAVPDVDALAHDQDGSENPEALVYVVGSPSSATMTAADLRPLSTAPTFQVGDECDPTPPRCDRLGAAGGFTGPCVANVPWISQIPPGVDDPSNLRCQKPLAPPLPPGPECGWAKTANCGPASLAIVNGFANQVRAVEGNIVQINRYLNDNRPIFNKFFEYGGHVDVENPGYGPLPRGISIGDLTRLGIHVFNLNLQSITAASTATGLEVLEAELLAGRPVVVLVYYEMNTNDAVPNKGHYMVLVGMDQDWVYVVDPGRNAAHRGCGDYGRYPRAAFKTSWEAKGFRAILLSPTLGIVEKSLRELPDGQVGAPYSAQFSAGSGKPPYTWRGTNLPDGLGLDPTTGLLSGTPKTPGRFSFSVSVIDSALQTAAGGSTSINITTAAGALTVSTPGELPGGKVGVSLQAIMLTAAGGVAPYSWSLVGTGLPAGLSLAASGQITGTPQSEISHASFTAQVTDSSSPRKAATKLLHMSVLPSNLPPAVYSVTASPSTVNVGGAAALICVAVDPQGSSLTFKWSATGGTLAGLGSTVRWTAPSHGGQYRITCAVSNAAGGAASADTLVSVTAAGLSSSVTPNRGVVGVTQFAMSGSGATGNGGVTSVVAYPDGTTRAFKTNADGTGKYAFSPFTATQVGIYTETETDDATGAKSTPLAWQADPSTDFLLTVTPSCGTAGPEIQLQWADVGATTYAVYRDGFLYAASISGTKYLDRTSLIPGSTYNYSIQARFAAGKTQISNSTSVTLSATCYAAQPPTVTGISPPSMPASNSNQTLTINGSNFQSGATLTFVPPEGGTIASTASKLTFVSSSQLSYQFNNLSDAGAWSVTVNNPDGQHSNAWNFTVTAGVSAPPVISSISPNPVPGSNSQQTITINGSGFVSGATVTLQSLGVPYPIPANRTTFVSSTQIQILANVTTQAASWTAQVTNPDGSASNVFNFTVTAGATQPVISSISPNPVPGSNSQQTITINGSGFVPGATVTLQSLGVPYPIPANRTTFVSSGQIQILANVSTQAASWTAQVTNPDGSASNVFNFTVAAGAGAPSIISVQPSSVPATTNPQSLSLVGTGFQTGLIVTVTAPGGSNQTFSGNQVQNLSPSSFQISIVLNTTGTWTIRVTNPDGQSSGPASVTVTAQSSLSVNPTTWQPPFTAGGSPATLGFQITNQGDSFLNVTTTAAASWLTVNGHPSDTSTVLGHQTITVNVTADPTGLSPGTYSSSLNVSAPNASNSPITIPVRMTILAALQITTTSLPDAISGQPYSFPLQGGGGSGSGYVWSLQQGINGVLPNGLSLNPQTGVISGTPTGISGSTTLTVVIVLQDSMGHQIPRTFTIVWREGLSISTNSPSNFQFTVGIPYVQPPNGNNSITFQASGGTPPYTWSQTGFPPGLSIDAASGTIVGTPTQPGSFSASITVKDSSSPQRTSTQTFALVVTLTQLTIQNPGRLPPASLPAGTVGTPYDQFISAGGGSNSGYSWSIIGTLPPGMTSRKPPGCTSTVCGLEFIGTPTQAGTFSFTVQVTDSLGTVGQQSLTLIINSGTPPQITTTTVDLSNHLATIGTAYSFTFAATGGAAPYQWSFVGASPDPGLQLGSSGLLSGATTKTNDCPYGPGLWVGPSYPSIYFQVRATDSAGQSSQSAQLCLPSYYPTPQISGLTPSSVTLDGKQHAITVSGSGFRSSASVYVVGPGQVSTTFVNVGALSFTAPQDAGSYQLWIVEPFAYTSNQVTLPVYYPSPTVSTVSAVLNNSTSPCRANLNCQLVISGTGLVYSTQYLIVQTNALLTASVYPSTPIPWNTVTTGAFSVSSAGTYTLQVTNSKQPGGGTASVQAQFTVAPTAAP